MTKEVALYVGPDDGSPASSGSIERPFGRYLRLAKPAISIAGFEEPGEPFRPPTFRLATCLSGAAMLQCLLRVIAAECELTSGRPEQSTI